MFYLLKKIIFFFSLLIFIIHGQEKKVDNPKINQQDSNKTELKTKDNKNFKQKKKKHFLAFNLNFQYLEELDYLISSLPHFGLNFPIEIDYLFVKNNFKHRASFEFNFGNYFTYYQNKDKTEYIQNTGINLQSFFDYQFLISIFEKDRQKILIGVWLGNSFSLTSPPYLAYNYATFHTVGFAMEWHTFVNAKNKLLLGGKISILGFGFRPSWTGYDFELEKILEEHGLLSVIGYSYQKYGRFVFWHNYIRFHPFVNYQFYLNELISFSLKYNLNITAVFFPQVHFSLRHTFSLIGVIFKW